MGPVRKYIAGIRARYARKGQTVVEYMLMLAVAVGMALTFGSLFYKNILKLFYIMVGITVGAGEPTS